MSRHDPELLVIVLTTMGGLATISFVLLLVVL